MVQGNLSKQNRGLVIFRYFETLGVLALLERDNSWQNPILP